MKTFAIIGLGMALAPHMASLADLKGRARLAHAVTRSPARGAAFEAAYGIPATGDLDMALADPAVDAVILLTPPDSHRELGRRILAAGKHLLIEKPAGLVTEDTRFLADLAESSGLLAAPVLQHRFRPAIRAVAAALASGAMGRLCGVHCLIPWWRPQSYYDAPGRGTYARDGGGVLLTQAVHTLDVLRALCGGARITAAQAVTSPLHRMEAEDLVCALATFGPDAAPGTIMATTACYPGMTETMTLILERALGGRMGGGVFSPALVMGSLTGLAFGIIATTLAPGYSGSVNVYAFAGMAAVGAAVLGAPISTALIVFEMTGDWQTGIAVMTSVSLSSALASTLVKRSFFLTQLEQRGIHLSEGPQAWLPHQLRITPVIRALGAEDAPAEDLVRSIADAHPTVAPTTTLAEALPLFERSGAVFLAVMACDGPTDPPRLIGSVHHIDVLRALNQALEQTAAEEHG